LKLGLGTAQFGQAYGIANKLESVSAETATAIISSAASNHIDLIDTASCYGDCELLLGLANVSNFEVVTKLPGLPENTSNPAQWAREMIAGSLHRLNIPSVSGLHLHRPSEILGIHGDLLYQTLSNEKAAGRISKLGISVYSPDELETIMQRYPFDLVQVPCNIIDRRFIESGWFERLKTANVEVHVRSVFLQGLLLMKTLPVYFDRWQEKFQNWHEWLADNSKDPVDACLGFLKAIPQIDRIIVGAVSVAQLEHIARCFQQSTGYQIPDIASTDEALVNPSLWQLS